MCKFAIVMFMLLPSIVFGIDTNLDLKNIYGTYKLSFYCLSYTEEMIPDTTPTELFESISELDKIVIRPDSLDIGTRFHLINPKYYFVELFPDGTSMADDSMLGRKTVTFYEKLYRQKFPYTIEHDVLLQVRNYTFNIQVLNSSTIAIPVNEYLYFYTRT